MKNSSWLDTPESAEAHFREMSKRHLTKQDALDKANYLRKMLNNQPLTMAEYDQIKAQSLHGIHWWNQPGPETAPQGFFHRLRHALQLGRLAFKAAMRKNQ